MPSKINLQAESSACPAALTPLAVPEGPWLKPRRLSSRAWRLLTQYGRSMSQFFAIFYSNPRNSYFHPGSSVRWASLIRHRGKTSGLLSQVSSVLATANSGLRPRFSCRPLPSPRPLIAVTVACSPARHVTTLRAGGRIVALTVESAVTETRSMNRLLVGMIDLAEP